MIVDTKFPKEPGPVESDGRTDQRPTRSPDVYQLLYEESLDAIMVTTPDGGILMANPAACAMFGRSEAELCAGGRAGIVAPEQPEVERLVRERAQTGMYRGILTCVRADAVRFPAETTSRLFTDTNGRVLTTMIIRDVSERQRAEHTLQQSEERYRSLVAALDEGMMLLGPDGTILTANASAERILGIPADHMAERTLTSPEWQAIREDGTPFDSRFFPATITLRTGVPCRNVVMGLPRPNGDPAWISINSQPLFRAGESRPYAVVTSFTDITERRRIEQEADRLHREVEAALTRRKLHLDLIAELAGDTETLMPRMLQAAARIVGADHGAIVQWDEARELLIGVESTIPDLPAGFRLRLGEGASGQAALRREPAILLDYQGDLPPDSILHKTSIRSAVAVPLIRGGRLLGALSLTISAPDRQATPDAVEELRIFGMIAAALLDGREKTQMQAVASAARELAHLMNNDLALAVGTLDMLIESPGVPADLVALAEAGIEHLNVASIRLDQLRQIVRYQTKQTPAGLSLDLEASLSE